MKRDRDSPSRITMMKKKNRRMGNRQIDRGGCDVGEEDDTDVDPLSPRSFSLLPPPLQQDGSSSCWN